MDQNTVNVENWREVTPNSPTGYSAKAIQRHEEQCKQIYDARTKEQVDSKARIEAKPLTAGLQRLLRFLAANGERITLADAPQEVATLFEGQVRGMVTLTRREPLAENDPLPLMRERGPYLPGEADPARTLADWLSRDPQTGDRATVGRTDAGRIEAAMQDDGDATQTSAPGIDQAILDRLRQALTTSPQGRSTKANAILAKVKGNQQVMRNHLRHLESIGEYDGFARARHERYKGSKGS